MAERPDPDPDTDLNTLADRLDDLANDRRWDCWNKHGDGSRVVPEGYDPLPDCCDAADGADSMRAAAVALRHHANLLDAIGDPDELRWAAQSEIAETGGGDDLRARLRALAAAVSPPPAPTTCPTCGSDDPETIEDACDMPGRPPLDPWHRQT